MISRNPRLIVGFDVAFDKLRERIQKIVDSSPEADFYYTDRYFGYMDVVFPGRHIRNVRYKKDTHNVESINLIYVIIFLSLQEEADALLEKLKHFMLLQLYSLMLIIASTLLNINTVNVRKPLNFLFLLLIFLTTLLAAPVYHGNQ